MADMLLRDSSECGETESTRLVVTMQFSESARVSRVTVEPNRTQQTRSLRHQHD